MQHTHLRYILLAFIFIFTTSSLVSQIEVNMYEKNVDGISSIYVDNHEHCPVTISVKFKLHNMTSSAGDEVMIVVPAKSTKIISSFEIKNKHKKSSYSTTASLNFGDHNQTTYDKDFEYHLPFEKNTTHLVSQGYNGHFSHHGENALDFDMKIGTPILAARAGTIIKVVEHNSKHCDNKSCTQYDNYVIVYHEDGTFAQYSHIKKNGVIVKAGDKVTTGQHIAYSGHVGWSTGPHLHFEVYLQKLQSKETISTKFLVDDGKTSALLKEDVEYTKGY